MANRHRKRSIVLLFIREMQITTLIISHDKSIKITKVKKKTISSFNDDFERLKLHITGNIKWDSYFGKYYGDIL